MTIKKVTKSAETEAAAVPPPTAGSATIADRFKLDAPAQPVKASAGAGTLVAVIAALVALGVSGLLTYMLYGHWTFLQGA